MKPQTFQQRADWLAHIAKACLQQHHTEQRAMFAPILGPGSVVVDVGAHAGQYAKLFARLGAKVWAFEPSAYARSILEAAVKWNRLPIEIIPMGLSDRASEEVLHTPVKKKGGLGFGLAHIGEDDSGRELVSQTIRLTTLDDFARDFERLDLIKMDIEGWEVPALRGALGTIGRLKPALYVEIAEAHLVRSGATPADVWAMLTPLGYTATGPDGKPALAYDGPGDYFWTCGAPAASSGDRS